MKSRWECPFSEWIFTLTHIKYILTFRYFRYRQVLSRFLYIFMHIDHRPLSKRWPQNKIGSKLCTWIDEVKTNVWLFISSLAQCQNLIKVYFDERRMVSSCMAMSLTDYGASQIISVTFYQFLTKEVFCQEVTFLSCHHAKIDPNLSTNKKFGLIFVCWYDEKNEGSDLSNFSGFFLVKVTISTTVSPLKKLQHHLFSEALQ